MCPVCGTPFGKRRRCYRCAPGGLVRTGHEVPCQQCGKLFYQSAWQLADVARNTGTYCSQACLYDYQRGREKVTGTRYKRPDGYIWVKVGIRSVKLEHRLVMEQILGRPLLADEQVNHINHIRDDNRPENLEVISPGDHARESNAYGKEMRRRARLRLKDLEDELAEYHRRYGPLE
jgi:hypothetical protein